MNNDILYKILIDNGSTIEKDVIDYGYMILITYLKCLMVLMPLSLIFHIQKNLFMFFLFFIPLRRYIGGYHMDTMRSCFIGSVILALSISFLSAKLDRIPMFFHIGVFIICFLLTIIFGVVDHKNKNINVTEKKVYKKRAIMIEISYFFIWLFFSYTDYYDISNTLMLIMMFFIISTCASKIKEKYHRY